MINVFIALRVPQKNRVSRALIRAGSVLGIHVSSSNSNRPMISPAFHRQQRQQQQQDAANAPSTGSGDSLALGAAPDRRAQLLVQAGQLRLWALNLGASLTLLPEPIPGASLVTGGFHPSHPHRPAAAGLFPVPNPGPRQSERSWAGNHRCYSLRQSMAINHESRSRTL